jgi:hypothetical protein
VQKLLERTVSADHSQCGVPGPSDIARRLNDATQYRRQGKLLDD